MDIIIYPQKLQGSINIIPSKSQAHRLLICAAFADKETQIICPQTSRDMEATANCLRQLGAVIQYHGNSYWVKPISSIPPEATLPCSESGSTLRFLLPIVGALGVDGTFLLEGRLSQRPLSPLWEEMERMGCVLTRPDKNVINCKGKLRAGDYGIDGGVSSQFITGLMIALHLIDGPVSLSITGNVESAPYIEMTKQALSVFGLSDQFSSNSRFISPGKIHVEGDWSNGAFFLAANSLGCDCNVTGLNDCSSQGDRKITEILKDLDKGRANISGKDIPDLIPILSVVASQKHGAYFSDIGRLRLKESDRIQSTSAMLKALGIDNSATDDALEVFPGKFTGGIVDTYGDHRIAMSAAIAAIVSTEPVIILGADCAAKSYPSFWAEYARLGGKYEQHLW